MRLTKFENFSNLNIAVSGLHLLAAPSTSEEVREQIVERAEKGERLTHAEVKKMIQDGLASHSNRASLSDSAAFSFGASTVPRYRPRFLMIETGLADRVCVGRKNSRLVPPVGGDLLRSFRIKKR